MACKDWARRDPSPLPRRSGAEPELLEEGPADLIRHDDELTKHALPAAAAAAAEAPAADLNAPHPVPQTQNFPLLPESLRSISGVIARERPRLRCSIAKRNFLLAGREKKTCQGTGGAGFGPWNGKAQFVGGAAGFHGLAESVSYAAGIAADG